MASLAFPFAQNIPSRTFPDKVAFPVTKMLFVKNLGKTLVGCNEGGILPYLVLGELFMFVVQPD